MSRYHIATKSVHSNPSFAHDVMKCPMDLYKLDDGGRDVRGIAFSFLQSHLRDEHWRGVTQYALEQRLKREGFKVARGRGYRRYHGGRTGLGVECNVVYYEPKETEHEEAIT